MTSRRARLDLDALIARTRPRRGRGSRAEPQVQAQAQPLVRLKVPSDDEIRDLIDELEKAQGPHGRAGVQRSRGGEWYEANIKGWGSVPAEVEQALEDWRVQDEIQFRAEQNMDWLLDALREEYHWLGKKSWTSGRSGGWWLLEDEDAHLSALREYEGIDRPFKRITGVYHVDPETGREMAKAYASAQAFLRDLDAIRTRVRQEVKNFWADIEDPASWEEELRVARQQAGAQEQDDEGSENRRGRRRGR